MSGLTGWELLEFAAGIGFCGLSLGFWGGGSCGGGFGCGEVDLLLLLGCEYVL